MSDFKDCLYCGNSFPRKGTKAYCNETCQKNNRKEVRKNKPKDGTKIIYNYKCEQCGKAIFDEINRNYLEHHYCSDDCRYADK